MPNNLLDNDDADAAEPRRHRLRLEHVQFDRLPSGRCTARVELSWDDGSKMLGLAEGHAGSLGELRLTADAALRALSVFFPSEIRFEMMGVKTLRVFDANIVFVAVGVTGDDRAPTRLLGSDLAEADPIRATVKAVLNATNRLVYSRVTTRV